MDNVYKIKNLETSKYYTKKARSENMALVEVAEEMNLSVTQLQLIPALTAPDWDDVITWDAETDSYNVASFIVGGGVDAEYEMGRAWTRIRRHRADQVNDAKRTKALDPATHGLPALDTLVHIGKGGKLWFLKKMTTKDYADAAFTHDIYAKLEEASEAALWNRRTMTVDPSRVVAATPEEVAFYHSEVARISAERKADHDARKAALDAAKAGN